ncbi:heat shock 70 kDa protein 14-like [Schistocerca cancellata]|uniref:heat shock 70 kDa protein 14-like n=1 Tax=Schistocerca cancellata TaxID=274614 RepID=UPI0021183DCD|nr:heat shock 70 kDa protein 14-like [Schistocerca cancellata]
MAGVFGIHVGNSSACLAYCKDGKVDIIADDSGNRIMPAIVAFVDGEESVGLPAKAALVRNASCTIVRNKKLLNDSIPDDELEHHIKSVKCKIVTEGGLKYEIRDEDKIAVYTPEGAMTCIYKKLFGFASTCVPPDTDLRTVLCVPLNFSKCSRQALARAAEDAGFDVLQVISEPIAALLAQGYGVESPDERGMCLVYRLGGATMDVTVVLCCAGMYTVKGHVYKANFGGDKFTEILANFLAEIFHQKWKLDPNDSRRAMAKLYNSSEQCKHILSTMSTAHCFIESLCEGTDFSYNVTRARFENLISAAVKMCTAPIEEALSQAGIDCTDINKVLLCGGSAKIPIIQQSVSEMFPNSELLCSVNPDELIALGAAKHGSYLKEPFDPGCDHLSYDIPVVTKSIFMKANDDKVLVIPAQTPVPVKVTKSLPLTLSGESIVVQVLEADDDDNDYDDDDDEDTDKEQGAVVLGNLTLDDVSASSSLTAEINVNSIGSLHASITDTATQKKSSFRRGPPSSDGQ